MIYFSYDRKIICFLILKSFDRTLVVTCVNLVPPTYILQLKTKKKICKTNNGNSKMR